MIVEFLNYIRYIVLSFSLCGNDIEMGQLLSEPDLKKRTSKIVTPKYTIGMSCMQGWRSRMEDAHTAIPILPGDNPPPGAFFGVFDGHGGRMVAEFSSITLPKMILNTKEYQMGRIKSALEFAFLDLDREMSRKKGFVDDMSGSTAIVVIIKNNVLYCANVGDSRAVAWLDGCVLPLSEDHKPSLPKELARITAAGGFVQGDRVNGTLALSRALGDYQFKLDPTKPPCKQIVTACPDIVSKTLNNKWKFIVLACDGIWEVLNNEEVGVFINNALDRGIDPDVVCEMLMDRCVAPITDGCGPGCDNMTVIIVVFNWT